jgi:hypothetical protein
MAKISKQHRDAIYERDENKCLQCGSAENLTIDHIVPTCKGGRNVLDNYQTMCEYCNGKKGNRIRDLRGLKVVGKIVIPKKKPKEPIPVSLMPFHGKEKIERINKEREKIVVSTTTFLANLKKKYPFAYSLIDENLWAWIYNNVVKETN